MSAEKDKRDIQYALIAVFLILIVSWLSYLTWWPKEEIIFQGKGEYQIYPDPVRTPGAINPNITQENIDETICHPDYRTGTVRPPKEYTAKLKRKQIEEYGYKDKNPRSYQEDHLIPLWIGGHPTDPKNLWPQPIYIEMGAKDKDIVENFIHWEVCKKEMTLRDAQRVMAKDWVSLYRKAKSMGFVDPGE